MLLWYRLSRVSGDSSSREPMLPCIMEGVASQDAQYTRGCPPALDELLGRTPHQEASCASQSAANLSEQIARHEARWPNSRYNSLAQSSLPRGFPTGGLTATTGGLSLLEWHSYVCHEFHCVP